MKSPGLNEQQLQKMKTHPGFIAALDQSGGSTPHALRLYGIKEGAWSNEEEMFTIVHQMRTRIIFGGIHNRTAASVVRAGATVLVAGSAIFNAQASVAENLQELRAAIAAQDLTGEKEG